MFQCREIRYSKLNFQAQSQTQLTQQQQQQQLQRQFEQLVVAQAAQNAHVHLQAIQVNFE